MKAILINPQKTTLSVLCENAPVLLALAVNSQSLQNPIIRIISAPE